jgi:hypothetical protein
MFLNASRFGGGEWLGEHIGDQLVLGSGPAIDVLASMFSHAPRLFDESPGRMFAGVYAPEHSIARRIRYASSSPSPRARIAVHAVDWIQWGYVRDPVLTACTEMQTSMLNSSLHYWQQQQPPQGGRERASWLPPSSPSSPLPPCRRGLVAFNFSIMTLSRAKVVGPGRNRGEQRMQWRRYQGLEDDLMLPHGGPAPSFRLVLAYARWQLQRCRARARVRDPAEFCDADASEDDASARSLCRDWLPSSCNFEGRTKPMPAVISARRVRYTHDI